MGLQVGEENGSSRERRLGTQGLGSPTSCFLQDLGLTNPQESIMGIFQSRENKSRETVDDWLASFRDRFPGYVRYEGE